MKNKNIIKIIGAGLAGCEAAYRISKRGIGVKLYEMRPENTTPAHKTGNLAELVCSNSLKSMHLNNASGLLKEEMKLFDSLIIKCALRSQIPGGKALCVDREIFSREIEKELKNSDVEIIRKEIDRIDPDEITIIATGPLTSDNMIEQIRDLTGEKFLYFFDAIAPKINKETIDFEKVFYGSRYLEDSFDYINCPMTKEEYEIFYNELINAETVEIKEPDKEIFFEGCMPVEETGKRGKQTLCYSMLKPVGLMDPKTKKMPYAVVQLRQDDIAASIYNMVGFQTRLKFPEQKRVFSLIPGLENAEFLQYGQIHKNFYIQSNKVLNSYLQMKKYKNIFFAGQITGVEGYCESAAMGIIAGINAAAFSADEEMIKLSKKTIMGSLIDYITNPLLKELKPINANFGILEKPVMRIPKIKRKEVLGKISLENLKNFFQKETVNK